MNVEENEVLAPSIRPNTATGQYENGVLTLIVDRKELDGAAIVGVGVVTFDVVGRGESEGQAFEGDVEAVDSAPDDLTGALLPYRLANRPPLQLRTTAVVGSTRPRAGRPFTYGIVVRRLDTYRILRSGTVTCSVSCGGNAPAGGGSVRSRSSGVQLAGADRGPRRTLRGTVTIRAAGAVVRSTFRLPVR